jgi:putative DNA-invertase from lambdoid prophage Rac
MQTFVYARVSTVDQTNDNQLLEIDQAGYDADTVYTDTISGKVPAEDRPEFGKMLDTITRTRKPKRLIVTKLDRLGRDAIDILITVRRLSELECAVKVLQLGELDLTSSAGKMVLSTLSAVAEMERDILVERTKAGLVRARAEGKQLGRPKLVGKKSATEILEKLSRNVSVAQIARDHGVSRMTIMRVRDAVSY